MKTTLVGYTGFVGGNLAASHRFEQMYNSKNISDAFSQQNGLVIYAGVRAEKFLANSDPDADRAVIENAISNIERMKPERLVLISTADVYKTPDAVDENTKIETEGLHAYGRNRYKLEKWVSENCPDSLIVRLPGLYGAGLKKNFIYDMITLVPSMLKKEKFEQLRAVQPLVGECYKEAANGFYKLQPVEPEKKKALRTFFQTNAFNSLCFTDSRAVYQFYGLANLWHDINRALEAGLKLVNFTSGPVSAAELYRFVRESNFENELGSAPVRYDIRSLYAQLFGGSGGYMYSKERSLAEIKQGVDEGLFVSE